MFIINIKNCVEDLRQLQVNGFCQNKPMITDRLMKQQLVIFMRSLYLMSSPCNSALTQNVLQQIIEVDSALQNA